MRTLKFLASIGVLAILGAIAVGIYFLGGYYSVAGTAPDPSLVAWALAQVRTASIERHAKDNPPLSLNDPAIVQFACGATTWRNNNPAAIRRSSADSSSPSCHVRACEKSAHPS